MHQLNATFRTPLPVVRAAVFAVVGSVLGVSAHHLVADGPVPWARGAVAAAALFVLGLAGTRKPRSLATVVMASCGGQAGLHLWLALTTPGRHHSTGIAMDTGAHEALHERLHDSSMMTAAHIGVAVLVAFLLHRADAVCWSLARGASVAVDAVRGRLDTASLMTGRPIPAGLRPQVLISERVETRLPSEGLALADVVVRRGPPPGLVHVI